MITNMKNSTESVQNKFGMSQKVLVKDKEIEERKLESQAIKTHV